MRILKVLSRKGNYGAGTVEIWDSGTYASIDKSDDVFAVSHVYNAKEIPVYDEVFL